LETEPPNHYATLGLDRRCTLQQIRAAYRVLAKRHHPDVNAGSAEAAARTRELNEAHETLSDPTRRRAYDRELEQQEEEQRPQAPSPISRNIAHDVHLRIDELLRGTCMTITVNDPANPDGPETYELEVPEETAPGTRIRIPRTGHFEGGAVQVRVRVRPNARLKARGADLRCDLRINSRRAAQGGTEMMQGATGTMVRVQIPAGVERGHVVRVPGEGLPKPRGGRGDLLVKIVYRPEVTSTRSRSRW
jgi:DnaJ-class molecular chaperone